MGKSFTSDSGKKRTEGPVHCVDDSPSEEKERGIQPPKGVDLVSDLLRDAWAKPGGMEK